MSTCECGRKMPPDWNGEPCFYCWIGMPAEKDDKVRFVTEADGIRIKGDR